MALGHGEQAQPGGKDDAALLKLFEFMMASVFLFLVPEGPIVPPQLDKVRTHPGHFFLGLRSLFWIFAWLNGSISP